MSRSSSPRSVTSSDADPVQTGSDADVPRGRRSLSVVAAGITLLSALISLFAVGPLPSRMRIHWTLGLGPYHGPEFAPTIAVLIAFPVCIAGTALVALRVDARVRRMTATAPAARYRSAVLIATLGVLLASQAALVAAAV